MGGSSVAMLAPYRGRLGLKSFLRGPLRCTSLGIFCTCSLYVCRVCDRTLRPFPVGGPFPCQQLYCFNPARPSTARLAGEMPSLREGDRCFWGCASKRSKQLPAVFLFLNPCIWLPNRLTRLVHEAAHTNIHHHPQRQEHEQNGRPTVTHQR